MYISSKKASKILGTHPNTLRKWADEGKIKHIRTPSNRRMYDVESFINGSGKKRFCYCRVSSTKQKDDLGRQVEFMRQRYPQHSIIEDVGSGLNFKRKGLLTLLDSVCGREVEEVVVAHRDRLSRFGFELIKWLIEKNGGKLLVLNDVSQSPQAELVADLMSIIHVFSCRLHGLRKYSSKIKKDQDLSQ